MRRAGVILAGLGTLFLAATAIWMAVGKGIALKIPKGQEERTQYEGEFRFFADPITYRPLAPGEELTLPVSIERHVFTLDDQFSGDLAVLQEDVSVDAFVIKKQLTSVYVLDRKKSYNVKDPRAYSWSQDNVQDRSGTYYPLFPMGMREGDGYMTWKAEIGRGAWADFLEKRTMEGVEVFIIEGSLDKAELVPSYVEFRGFPESMPFEQLAQELKASGLDLLTVAEAVMPVLTPEDRQALAGALGRPVPLNYYLTSYKKVAVEPSAGFPMAIMDATETVSVSPDHLAIIDAFGILERYASDPGVAPLLAQFEALKSRLASLEPRKLYTQTYAQTEESIRESAKMARKNLKLIRAAKLFLPAAGFALGGLLLVAGIFLSLRKKKPAAA